MYRDWGVRANICMKGSKNKILKKHEIEKKNSLRSCKRSLQVDQLKTSDPGQEASFSQLLIALTMASCF